MLQGWVIVVTSFAYLGLLFAIAYYADKRADAGRSMTSPAAILWATSGDSTRTRPA